ncbi:MAG: alpha/beta hydrolase family protein, partial [Caulobacteraceae bacterium]
MRSVILAAFLAVLPAAALAASPPAAIFTDPAPDAAHPARLASVRVPSHGALMNAVWYVPTGAGPHPTVLLLHGLPGNERNFDLAQAIRRAGWNVLVVHYRGAWGSGGAFSLANAREDVDAALVYVRSADAAKVAAV